MKYTVVIPIALSSITPGRKHLSHSGVVPETAVDLGLSLDVLITGSGISSSDVLDLFLSEGYQFFLVLLGDAVELVDGPVNGLDDVWEDRVLAIVHASVGDSFESQIEHG